MLKKIRIQNCFRHPDTTLEFTTGLTGIFGANEAGKSLIFEMISYALFGANALRGSAPDYKKLIVTLDFQISGINYQVYRSAAKALLTRGGLELATGQKPVSAEIIKLLGYDYRVFCVANYSPQGELCNLSRMKPTERKSMVDNVIGLGIIDKLIVSIATKTKELNGVIQGRTAGLMAPLAPIMPENYVKSSEIDADIQALTADLANFNYIDHWLRNSQQVEPVRPVKPELPSKEDLQEAKRVYQERAIRIAELQKTLLGYQPPAYPKETLLKLQTDWKTFDEQSAMKAQLLNLQRTFISIDYTREQLDQLKNQSEDYSKWTMKQQLEAVGKNHCPKCQHEWFLRADELAPFADAVQTDKPAFVPTAQHYANLELYEKQGSERERVATELQELGEITPPSVSKLDVERGLANVERQEAAEAAQTELKELQAKMPPTTPAFDTLIQSWTNYEANLAVFEDRLKTYLEWQQEHAQKTEIWEQQKGLPERVASLRHHYQISLVYEQQLKRYAEEIARYQASLDAIQELREEFNDLERAREAMRNLRISVKKFLVPSLNKAASHLLSQMSGGVRQVVDINEDFEINIDGQGINTLSGSGQAISNLAIRIALGQVLISKKFPMFMADEIDGDMDEERADFTAECLRRITKHVPQFLLISHKRPLADNYIELGKA